MHLPDFVSPVAAAPHTFSIAGRMPAPETGYTIAPDHRGQDVLQTISQPAPGRLPYHLSWLLGAGVPVALLWKEAILAPRPPHGSPLSPVLLVANGSRLQLRETAQSSLPLSAGSAVHRLPPSDPCALKMEQRSQATLGNLRDSSATLDTQPALVPGVPNPRA